MGQTPSVDSAGAAHAIPRTARDPILQTPPNIVVDQFGYRRRSQSPIERATLDQRSARFSPFGAKTINTGISPPKTHHLIFRVAGDQAVGAPASAAIKHLKSRKGQIEDELEMLERELQARQQTASQ